MSGGKYDVPEAEFKKKSPCRIPLWLLVLLVVLSVCLLAAVIALAFFLLQTQGDLREAKKLNSIGISSYRDGERESDICLTRTCIETANRVNLAMDPSVSPCDNFYQFACGGWEKRTSFPFYSPYGWSILDELGTVNSMFFRNQLELPISTSSFGPDVKARTLYETCMNSKQVGDLGLSEAFQIIEGMGGLWSDTSIPFLDFDLTGRLIELARVGSFPLVGFGGDFHRYDMDVILLQISPPENPLLFSRADNKQLWELLAEEYVKIWNDLYIGAQTAAPPPQAFLDVYYMMNDLKETLADDRIKFYRDEWNDTVVSLEELQAIVPAIDWQRMVNAIFPNKEIYPKVVLKNKAYLIVLQYFITKTWNSRVLDNFLKFAFVLDNLAYFPYKYREVQENLLNRYIFNSPSWHPPPRWMFCVEQMQLLMPLVLGRWYVEDYLERKEQVISDVDEMIENIRDLYIKVLENTHLLDEATSKIAIEKIKAMDKHVAFPNFVRNLTVIEDAYSKVVANDSWSFFTNLIETRVKSAFQELEIIGVMSEEDRLSLWLDHAFVTNGYYSANLNRFTILAGILQGAFYNLENPKYMNYGSMGFVIGHEFSHGFDDTGRHFDINGLLNSWWTNTSESNYDSAKRCFIQQYNDLEVAAFDSNDTFLTNGNVTLDENIADNAATYVVYQAYEKWVNENGPEQLLPTPYLKTWKQLYYVSQAQGWCAKYKSSGLSVLLDTFAHSQKEARVNGMYQNSHHFSSVFQCPTGSFMNPEKKCSLW